MENPTHLYRFDFNINIIFLKWTLPRYLTAILAGEQTRLNVKDFSRLLTAVVPLKRDRLTTFIIHSTENKAVNYKGGMTSVNSNNKSSHVASNFAAICGDS